MIGFEMMMFDRGAECGAIAEWPLPDGRKLSHAVRFASLDGKSIQQADIDAAYVALADWKKQYDQRQKAA